MRKIFLLIAAVSFVACAKSENAMSDSSAMAAATPMAPAALMAADLRGTWTGVSMPEGSDSVVSRWTCVDDGAGMAKCTEAGAKDTITYTYTLDADSAIYTSAPFKPPTPPRAPQVIDRAVARLSGGKLVGTFVTTVAAKPDSVFARGRFEGTRAP